MKKILFICTLIIFIFIYGCLESLTNGAWNMENILPQPQESICNTIAEDESMICKHLRYPESIDFVLYMLNAVILDNASAKEVQKELDAVNEIIWYIQQPSITGAAFTKYVLEHEGSMIALAASKKIGFLDFKEELLPADKDMILMHLNDQKALIEITLMTKK